ncbi:MAG TPA: polysaccharide biosynthesis C-terminal domain-containing protein [Acidobacteriota bacterium]|nr:polysaccharide biosynthesis C-terminal domain-containing protein [Acidobacteriota bacterium]
MAEDSIREELGSMGRHSSIYFISAAMSRAVGFLMIPIYTHYLAPKSYGGMEMIEILSSAIAIFVAMGVVEALPRSYYEMKEQADKDRVVSTALLGLSVIGIPLVFSFLAVSGPISAAILADGGVKRCLQLAILSAWSYTISETISTYLRMTYQSRLFLVVSGITLIIAVLLNILFIVFLGYDILGFFLSQLITQGLMGLVLAVIILRRIGCHFSMKVLRRMVAFGFPLVFPQIALLLGFSSNRFFLRWNSGFTPAEALTLVGLFALGHKFGVLVNRFVNGPLNSFWSPRRLELIVRDSRGDREVVGRIATYAAMLSIFFSLILANSAESLIALFSDTQYQNAHIVVPLVAIAYVFLGLETHFKAGLLQKRKTSRDAMLSVVALAVILLWNYLLIPRFGLIAAAASNAAGFCVRLVIIYYISQKLFRIPFEIRRIFSMLVLALILYLFGQTIRLNSQYLTLIIRGAIAMLFPFILFAFNFYRPEEIRWGREGITRIFSLMRQRLSFVR